MSLLQFFSKRRYKPEQPENTRSLYWFSGGTNINPESSMEVAAFYSGLIYLSTTIAKLPWEIKDADNRVLFNHHARKLLRLRPNGEMNSFIFRLNLVQDAILGGNGYAEIERDLMNRPIALWHIPHRHVDPFRDVNGELLYRIIGGAPGGQGDALVPQKDMFHIRNFHVKGLVGMSLVDYAKEVLGIAKGADIFANSLYANGALPSSILTTDKKLSPEAIKRLKESWSENHAGRKVGNTAILEEGLTYQAISHSPEALQMLESKKMSVLDIARYLRIPPTKLFDISAATFDNQENSNLEVVTDVIDAWAKNIEMETDIKILSEQFNGYKNELDIFEVFRGDMETRSEYYQRMFGIGGISSNEIRRREGLPPQADGDKYFISSNNFSPMDRIDEIIDSQVEPQDKEAMDAIVNILNKKNS